MASLSLLYLSSQEIWSTVGTQPHPHVSNCTMLAYAVFFFVMAFLIHVEEVRKISSKPYVIIIVALISYVVDLVCLSSAEYVTLLAISVLPQDPLSDATVKLLLLGAMPGSLGVVTLSSLSISSFRERASKLKREAEELAKQAKTIDERTEKMTALTAEFEAKTRAFMESEGKSRDKIKDTKSS